MEKKKKTAGKGFAPSPDRGLKSSPKSSDKRGFSKSQSPSLKKSQASSAASAALCAAAAGFGAGGRRCLFFQRENPLQGHISRIRCPPFAGAAISDGRRQRSCAFLPSASAFSVGEFAHGAEENFFFRGGAVSFEKR